MYAALAGFARACGPNLGMSSLLCWSLQCSKPTAPSESGFWMISTGTSALERAEVPPTAARSGLSLGLRCRRFANRAGAWLYRVRDQPKAEHEARASCSVLSVRPSLTVIGGREGLTKGVACEACAPTILRRGNARRRRD